MIQLPNLDCKFIYEFFTLLWQPMPLGLGRGQNVGLRHFCHILTLLPPGASVFHKHMSSCDRISLTHRLHTTTPRAIVWNPMYCIIQGIKNLNLNGWGWHETFQLVKTAPKFSNIRLHELRVLRHLFPRNGSSEFVLSVCDPDSVWGNPNL